MRAALLALLLAFSQGAMALAAIEYYKISGAAEQMRVMEPIVVVFVSRGYKKVPNWAELDSHVRDLIREKGYTYQSIESVAEEAAIKAGMIR